MRLSDIIERLRPGEKAIIVFGMAISPRCGYCNRRFHSDDLVMVSVRDGCGYHMHCQATLDQSPRN